MRKRTSKLTILSAIALSLSRASAAEQGEPLCTAYDCQHTHSMPHNPAIERIYFQLNSGEIVLKPSKDHLIHLKARGEEVVLKNIQLKYSHGNFWLKDDNDSDTSEITPQPDTDKTNELIQAETDKRLRVAMERCSFTSGHYAVGGAISSFLSEEDLPKLQPLIFCQQSLAHNIRGSSTKFYTGDTNSRVKICLRDVIWGERGLIHDGVIIFGNVEQNGIVYGAGTKFVNGKAYQPGEIVPSSLTVNEKKPLKVTIYIPQRDSLWDTIKIDGFGDSKITIRDIQANQFIFNTGEKASLKATGLKKVDKLFAGGVGSSSISCSGSVGKELQLEGRDDSSLTYVQENPESTLNKIYMNTIRNAKISLSGNQLSCMKYFDVWLRDHSRIRVENIKIKSKDATIKAYDLSCMKFMGSYNCFNIIASEEAKVFLTKSFSGFMGTVHKRPIYQESSSENKS